MVAHHLRSHHGHSLGFVEQVGARAKEREERGDGEETGKQLENRTESGWHCATFAEYKVLALPDVAEGGRGSAKLSNIVSGSPRTV